MRRRGISRADAGEGGRGSSEGRVWRGLMWDGNSQGPRQKCEIIYEQLKRQPRLRCIASPCLRKELADPQNMSNKRRRVRKKEVSRMTSSLIVYVQSEMVAVVVFESIILNSYLF